MLETFKKIKKKKSLCSQVLKNVTMTTLVLGPAIKLLLVFNYK